MRSYFVIPFSYGCATLTIGYDIMPHSRHLTSHVFITFTEGYLIRSRPLTGKHFYEV